MAVAVIVVVVTLKTVCARVSTFGRLVRGCTEWPKTAVRTNRLFGRIHKLVLCFHHAGRSSKICVAGNQDMRAQQRGAPLRTAGGTERDHGSATNKTVYIPYRIHQLKDR